MNSFKALRSIFRHIKPYLFFSLISMLVLRLGLFFLVRKEIDETVGTVLQSFGIGFLFDLTIIFYLFLPWILYRIWLPKSWERSSMHRLASATFLLIYALYPIVSSVIECLFWDDIGKRINFLAWDYLVYPEEVIGHLISSYPLEYLIPALCVLGGLAFRVLYRNLEIPAMSKLFFVERVVLTGAFLFFAVLSVIYVDGQQSQFSRNEHLNELSKNGFYNLFTAIRHYDPVFEEYYLTSDSQEVAKKIHAHYEGDEVEFLSDDPWDITRRITNEGEERSWNVIMVVMESMSGTFMSYHGGDENLTPNLDALTQESLFFSQHYACGTRTVRGVEALSLSVPPCPGPSRVKRRYNHRLYSLGYVFRDRGYDSRFFYSGYGRFDNMGPFFASNGFDLIDRHDFTEEESHFGNVWGLCDEDLYHKVIREADEAQSFGQHFMFMVMNTSNHPPYTVPKIPGDLAHKDPKKQAVRYADYAIGVFLEEAKKHSWFDDTLFVFVSDHAACSAGEKILDLPARRIPFIVYAPKWVKAEESKKLACQLDVAPTLLGLLNFSYVSRFYGQDLMKDRPGLAVVGDHEKLGIVTEEGVSLLQAQQRNMTYPEGLSKDIVEMNTAIYQHAADWRRTMQRVPTR